MENGTTTPTAVKEPWRGSAAHKRKFLAGLAKNDALEALYATGIQGTARQIFTLIVGHTVNGEPAWPNQARLAFESGRCVRTVQTAIRLLERSKLIETVHRREINKKFKYGRAYKPNWSLLWDCYLLWLRHDGDWQALAESDSIPDLEREAESSCNAGVPAVCSSPNLPQLAACESKPRRAPLRACETMFRDAPKTLAAPQSAAVADEAAPVERRANSREHGTSQRALGTNKRAQRAREVQERQQARIASRADHDRQTLPAAATSKGIADILSALSSSKRAVRPRVDDSGDSPHLPGVRKAAESSSSVTTAAGASP